MHVPGQPSLEACEEQHSSAGMPRMHATAAREIVHREAEMQGAPQAAIGGTPAWPGGDTRVSM